jgi:ABC-type nitrate/sulfonate/bicarbonate transport system permease component
MGRILGGFVLGSIPGLALGVMAGLSPWVRAAISPIVAATYPIPKSAIAPLVLLIFGMGNLSHIVLVGIGVFYLVFLNAMAGVMNIDRIYLDMGRNYGARGFELFRSVAVPGALPLIMTGLKLGMGMAMILIAIAEMVGAKSGVGYLIWESWQTFAVERMYVGLLVISVLGFITSLVMDEIERLMIPWKPR